MVVIDAQHGIRAQFLAQFLEPRRRNPYRFARLVNARIIILLTGRTAYANIVPFELIKLFALGHQPF